MKKSNIDLLLEELTDLLVKKFGNSINFILLLGSAARGEFKEGISDIDLIIEVKDEKTKEELNQFLSKILWKLDSKYKTKIKKAIENDVFKLLSSNVKLYTPYEIFVEGEVDWKNGKINKSFGLADPFISLPLFAEKIRREGKILYGKDIRKEIRVKFSIFERLKLFFTPYILSLLAFLVSIFKPDIGLKLSLKALFYGIDDHIFILTGKIEKDREKKIKLIKRIVKHYSTRLLREAIEVKYNFEIISKEWTYMDKLFFSFETIFNIAYNDWISFIYLLKSLIIRK